jgi:release factor glutamine methyltransferase
MRRQTIDEGQLKDEVLEAAKRLSAAGIDSARLDARLLWEHAQGDAAAFDAAIARRLTREPVAAITGHKEFWSLDFEVGPGVLIPRPDTETLIEEAIRLVPDRKTPLAIADLGTGSGAILLAALAEFPNAHGVGFESSPTAHAYAARNAARLAPGRADIRLADWSAASKDAEMRPFDLVFSNPPYIPAADIESLAPDVRDHEPRAALDGGPDGLDAYRALGALLPGLLKPGGHALLEIGMGQAAVMEPLFPGLELVRMAPDLSGIPRCVVLKPRNFLGNPGPIQ